MNICEYAMAMNLIGVYLTSIKIAVLGSKGSTRTPLTYRKFHHLSSVNGPFPIAIVCYCQMTRGYCLM